MTWCLAQGQLCLQNNPSVTLNVPVTSGALLRALCSVVHLLHHDLVLLRVAQETGFSGHETDPSLPQTAARSGNG